MEVIETGATTSAYVIDPLNDSRWPVFLERQPDATIFHTPDWLRVLRTSFGYEPVVVTTASPGEELRNGVPFCIVRSAVTGNRVVSLPFSDHCEILGVETEDIQRLFAVADDKFPRREFSYVEVRPLCSSPGLESKFRPVDQFLYHTLDLSRNLEVIFRGLHKDSVQRRIRRASNAGLRYECGNSEKYIKDFYKLHIETRRRLGLPPFPIKWFRALSDNLKDHMKIRVAFAEKKAIASIVTLHHRQTVTYKYGASDAAYHRLGAMPFLFWQAIKEGKAAGAYEFDFGRSESTSVGLIQFKRRWATRESVLTYWQAGPKREVYERSYQHKRLAQRICVHMPRPLLVLLAQLYRHIG